MLEKAAVTSPSELFRDLAPKVYAFLSRATGAPASDVEDLLQDTLLAAWRGREGFRAEASPATWVFAIARNKVRDWRRGRARASVAALGDLAAAPLAPDLLQSAEARRLVRRALSRMDPAHARVLVLAYFDGLSTFEIAAELDERQDAVESRLRRARDAFRRLVEEGARHESPGR
jgi:RNA polymerase sigma-70 factor (ECF subfamily)